MPKKRKASSDGLSDGLLKKKSLLDDDDDDLTAAPIVPAKRRGAPAAPTAKRGAPAPALRGASSSSKGRAPPPPDDDDDLDDDDMDDDDDEFGEDNALDDIDDELDSGEEGDEFDDDEGEEDGEDGGESDDGEEGEDGESDDDDNDHSAFERKARKTMAEMASRAEADAADLKEGLARERFELPSAAELAEEGRQPPDVAALKSRAKEIAEVLAEFGEKREAGRDRHEYVAQLAADLCACYGYNPELMALVLNLFSPSEAMEFLEASETPRPVTVRANTLKTRRRELAQALIARNVNLDPIKRWSREGLQIYSSPVPIGATPEYLAGQYMIQSASSFLPVLALAPGNDMRVLDMAAAPGGKTSHLAALMNNTGTIVANDSNKARIKALLGNLARLGVRNAIVTNADAREFPKLMGGFDRVLLDAPCAGLGVISKDPSVKAEKQYADVLRCHQLQKELLLAAIDSCNANAAGGGGHVVYSTCSVSVEENEEVVAYALAQRHVKLVDSGLEFGREGFTRYRAKRFPAALKLCRRFYPHAHNMDGFFVAKLRKLSNAGGGGGVAAASAATPVKAPAAKAAAAAASDAVAALAHGAGGPLPAPGAERPGGGKHGAGGAKPLKGFKGKHKGPGGERGPGSGSRVGAGHKKRAGRARSER